MAFKDASVLFPLSVEFAKATAIVENSGYLYSGVNRYTKFMELEAKRLQAANILQADSASVHVSQRLSPEAAKLRTMRSAV